MHQVMLLIIPQWTMENIILLFDIIIFMKAYGCAKSEIRKLLFYPKAENCLLNM